MAQLFRNIAVIDTCVLLHHTAALNAFSDTDLYLPLPVLRELDRQKSRRDATGFAARKVFRTLRTLGFGNLAIGGVWLPGTTNRVFVSRQNPCANGAALESLLREREAVRTQGESLPADRDLIAFTRTLADEYPDARVELITNDMALLITALSLGVCARDFEETNGSQDAKDALYRGVRTVEIMDFRDSDTLWGANEPLSLHALSGEMQARLSDLSPNECVIFTYGKGNIPAIFKRGALTVLKDKSSGPDRGKKQFSGITHRNLEQKFALTLLSDRDIPLVSLVGPAGTGKTILALSVALQAVDDEAVRRIIVIKPMVAVGGADIGYLPGDKYEKVAAWLGPMKDNIQAILGSTTISGEETFEKMVSEGIIEVEALAFVQGRSLADTILIVDEVQNLHPDEVRMLIERIAEGSKVFLLGDLSQIQKASLDPRTCGLFRVVQGGAKSELCASIVLTEVQRSPLAAAAHEIFGLPDEE